MIYLLSEILINFYQGFLMIHYANVVFVRQSSAKNTLLSLLFSCLIGCFFTLYLFLPISLPDTVVFIFPLFFLVATKRGTWFGRILYIVILGVSWTCVVMFVEAIYTYVFRVALSSILSNELFRLGYIISCNVVLSFVTFILYNTLSKQPISEFSRPIMVIVTLLMLSEFALSEILFIIEYTYDIQDSFIMLVNLAIMLLTILSIVIFEFMLITANQKRIAELDLQTNSVFEHYQTDLKAMYEKLLSSQHDLRKKIKIFEELENEKRAGIGNSAVKEFVFSDSDWECEYMTGNMIVDAILTAKTNVMKKNDICFEFSPYPLHHLPIDEHNFCIMLTHILDNAIEGVLRITDPNTEKKIALHFAKSWDMFFLTCTNTLNDETIKKKDKYYITSKRDHLPHGLGIMSIEKIAKSNDGICAIANDQQSFSIKILLPEKEIANVTKSQSKTL